MPEKQNQKEKVSDTVRDQFARIEYARDTERGVLGGVIAGLSNYTGWDVTLLRVLFVLLLIFTAFVPFAIAYLVVWICAPDEATASTPRAKKATSKSASTSKTTVYAEDREPAPRKTTRAQNNTSIVARVILMVFGIIGFCIFVPLLITFVPITILSIIGITSAAIVDPPLFIATAILVGIFLFTIAAAGLHLSVALVTARLGRASLISLVASIIFAIMLGTAAATTGTLWAHNVGRDGVETTLNSLSDDIHIDINDFRDHNNIKIDLGPIHINTD